MKLQQDRRVIQINATPGLQPHRIPSPSLVFRRVSFISVTPPKNLAARRPSSTNNPGGTFLIYQAPGHSNFAREDIGKAVVKDPSLHKKINRVG